MGVLVWKAEEATCNGETGYSNSFVELFKGDIDIHLTFHIAPARGNVKRTQQVIIPTEFGSLCENMMGQSQSGYYAKGTACIKRSLYTYFTVINCFLEYK